MRLPSSDEAVRVGLQLVTFQTVGMAYVIAFGDQDAANYQQILFSLTAAGLADAWSRADIVREAALTLLRGGTVAALFMAGIDFGPDPAQVRAATFDVLAALLLGFLVLIAQSRRAGEARDERRANAAQIRAIADDIAELRAHAEEMRSVQAHPAPPAQESGSGYALAGALAAAGLLGIRWLRRR